MHKFLAVCIFLALMAPVTLAAQDTGAVSEIGIDEKLGDTAKLGLGFVDADGDSVFLSDVINKPTVITLVYGLAFGMVLVLMVVPALIAIGDDFAKAKASVLRGLRHRSGGLRLAYLAGFALVLGWLGVTMGWTAVTGALPQVLAQASPMGTGLQAAFALFLGGIAIALLLAYVVAASLLGLQRRA